MLWKSHSNEMPRLIVILKVVYRSIKTFSTLEILDMSPNKQIKQILNTTPNYSMNNSGKSTGQSL